MTYPEFRAKQQKRVDKLRRELMREEVTFLVKALVKAKGNIRETARNLGVTDASINERIERLMIRERIAVIREAAGQKQGVRSKV